MRESVDQIDIERDETIFAQPLDGLFGFFFRLDAVNRLLYGGIKILDSEGGAVESGFPQGGDVVADRELDRQAARL